MSLSVAPKIWTFFIKLDVCYEQLKIAVYMWALNNEKLDMYNLSEFQSPRIWTWLYTKKIVVWAPSMVRIQPQFFYYDFKFKAACEKF